MTRKRALPDERKVWRMSANAPLGEVVVVKAVHRTEAPSAKSTIEADWPETDWTSSSFALLSGCEVRDYTASMSERVFDRLFKD